MSDYAIEISNLGKRYRIHHEARHDNLRDTVAQSGRRLLNRLKWGTSASIEEFWALRKLSLQIKPGEAVGVVGRNGAGKSTLLKLISRITQPTEGLIRLNGRVASLLEVGTGFHPELTGRENIFLNGAILGMRQKEIRQKFDAIVDFAEIEKFIDTPVKRYSSGMYVRLAFAVAAHLDPEILVIDEVLAVGDTRFQKKCLGKMEDVTRSHNRTILFVSHQLNTVRTLCPRSVLLQNGELIGDGDTLGILSDYEGTDSISSGTIPIQRNPVENIWVEDLELQCPPSESDENFVDLTLAINGESAADSPRVSIAVHLATPDGLRVAHLGHRLLHLHVEQGMGKWKARLKFPQINRHLAGGRYELSLLFQSNLGNAAALLPRPAVIEIPDADPFDAGIYFSREKHGLVPLRFEGAIEKTD